MGIDFAAYLCWGGRNAVSNNASFPQQVYGPFANALKCSVQVSQVAAHDRLRRRRARLHDIKVSRAEPSSEPARAAAFRLPGDGGRLSRKRNSAVHVGHDDLRQLGRNRVGETALARRDALAHLSGLRGDASVERALHRVEADLIQERLLDRGGGGLCWLYF